MVLLADALADNIFKSIFSGAFRVNYSMGYARECLRVQSHRDYPVEALQKNTIEPYYAISNDVILWHE